MEYPDIMQNDDYWERHPKTDNKILAWVAKICGTVGGWLLDFYLRYGDRYEIKLDNWYGGDTMPIDSDFESWMREATQEIFNEIDDKGNIETKK